MIRTLLRSMMLIIMLLLASMVLYAQEEDAEELPEIPYYRASSNFNVPVLELEGWENQSTKDDALFVNLALNARIHVTAVDLLDADEAIQMVVSSLVDGDLPDPSYNERKGLPNGTWTQQHFILDETSISSFALLRRDRTFVVTVVETNPNYDARILAVRPPMIDAASEEESKGDFRAGMEEAVAALGLVDDPTPDSEMEPQEYSGGEWLVYSYESSPPVTVTGFMFNDIVYATEVSGEASAAGSLAEAFNIVFLGFFITPSNSNFLYLGLAAVAIIFLALLGSMMLRYQNAQKDLKMIEQLSDNS